MSIINDALKKAARLRAEEQADVAPPMPGGGGRGPRQGAPVRTQSAVLIAGAAVALIVVSAVITGVLVTSKPDAKPAAAEKPVPVAPKAQEPLTLVVHVPVAASVLRPPPPTPAPAVAAPPIIVNAAVTPGTVSAAAQGLSTRVQAFIDNLHISGVRSAGADSKALIDGHVYKVNDLLDSALGVRLVKIDSDRLTFVDAQDETFLKSF